MLQQIRIKVVGTPNDFVISLDQKEHMTGNKIKQTTC